MLIPDVRQRVAEVDLCSIHSVKSARSATSGGESPRKRILHSVVVEQVVFGCSRITVGHDRLLTTASPKHAVRNTSAPAGSGASTYPIVWLPPCDSVTTAPEAVHVPLAASHR
jgi:hypothetical protein